MPTNIQKAMGLTTNPESTAPAAAVATLDFSRLFSPTTDGPVVIIDRASYDLTAVRLQKCP